jgi:hypothetical protein
MFKSIVATQMKPVFVDAIRAFFVAIEVVFDVFTNHIDPVHEDPLDYKPFPKKYCLTCDKGLDIAAGSLLAETIKRMKLTSE